MPIILLTGQYFGAQFFQKPLKKNMKLSGKWYQMLPNVGRTNREPNVGRFRNHENDTGDHQRIFYTISNDYSIDQNCEIRYTNKINVYFMGQISRFSQASA